MDSMSFIIHTIYALHNTQLKMPSNRNWLSDEKGRAILTIHGRSFSIEQKKIKNNNNTNEILTKNAKTKYRSHLNKTNWTNYVVSTLRTMAHDTAPHLCIPIIIFGHTHIIHPNSLYPKYRRPLQVQEEYERKWNNNSINVPTKFL